MLLIEILMLLNSHVIIAPQAENFRICEQISNGFLSSVASNLVKKFAFGNISFKNLPPVPPS